jgi:hypothetical protein
MHKMAILSYVGRVKETHDRPSSGPVSEFSPIFARDSHVVVQPMQVGLNKYNANVLIFSFIYGRHRNEPHVRDTVFFKPIIPQILFSYVVVTGGNDNSIQTSLFQIDSLLDHTHTSKPCT